MAAFSSLALIGLGLAGGVAASKVLAPKPTPGQGTGQPAPTPTPLLAPTPPTTSASTSQNTQAAKAKGALAKRRAGGPTSSTNPVRTTGNAQAVFSPQTLLGY